MDSCLRWRRYALLALALITTFLFSLQPVAAGSVSSEWDWRWSDNDGWTWWRGGATKSGRINYGDFSDTPPGEVMFLDVRERSRTDRGKALYGMPEVEDNMLTFEPEHFHAESKRGARDVTKGKLKFDIMPIDGEAITALSIMEGGTYELMASHWGNAWVAANLSTSIEITEVDGELLDQPVTISASERFKAMATSGDDNDSGDGEWSNMLFIDLIPELAELGITAEIGVTKAEVTVVNKLAADLERERRHRNRKHHHHYASDWDDDSDKWWGDFWDDDGDDDYEYDYDRDDEWDDDDYGDSYGRKRKRRRKNKGFANIWKNDLKIELFTPSSPPTPGEIPEPTTAALVGIALAIGAGRRQY